MKLSKAMTETLQRLIELVGEDQVREIEIERGVLGYRRIRVAAGINAAAVQPVAQVAPQAADSADTPAPEEPDDTEGLHSISSPMVGMFYRAPNPDSPAFVEESDVVSVGQTLCIIEAMKIMNEIEADIKGRVVRVLVENGNPVEYNTPLFLIEPL